MKMRTADLAQLKLDAIDNIIFHATPREWLRRGSPWVLDRGEGALLYDVDGREFLDALSGGVFVVLARYGREEIARAMGLFVRPMGGTILLGPPLIFTWAQAERTVEVLDVALSQVEARVALPAAVGR